MSQELHYKESPLTREQDLEVQLNALWFRTEKAERRVLQYENALKKLRSMLAVLFVVGCIAAFVVVFATVLMTGPSDTGWFMVANLLGILFMGGYTIGTWFWFRFLALDWKWR